MTDPKRCNADPRIGPHMGDALDIIGGAPNSNRGHQAPAKKLTKQQLQRLRARIRRERDGE